MKNLDKKNKTVIGYIIIGTCLLVFLVLTVSALTLNESYDPETFCLDVVPAHTIILIDKTDAINTSQQHFILDYINREKNKLKDHQKLSLFTLTKDAQMSTVPIFSKCNPGTGEDANELYQNPKMIRLKFDKLFSEPLLAVLGDVFSDNTDTQSPIFETIREFSYRDDFSSDVPQRTLIIISDMMQHTANYSHYRGRINYNDFSKTAYADEVTANLDSMNIKIVYLLRDHLNNIQGSRHLLFWDKYFQAMGADVTEVRKVR